MRTFAVLSALAAVALAQNSTSQAVSQPPTLVPTPASSAGSTLSSVVSGSAPASAITVPASLSSGLTYVPAGPSGSVQVSVGTNTTVIIGSLPPGYTTTGSPAASGSAPAGSASASASGKGAASNVQAAGAGVLAGLGFVVAAMV